MTVSVVIPYFSDAAPYLGDCVASVLAQTYRDFEVVISEDGARCPVERVGRVRILREAANSGTYAALNRGIRKAKGDLIAILAADDMLTPDSLRRRVDAMVEGVVLVCGQAVSVELMTFKEALKAAYAPLPRRRVFYGPTILMRRATLDAYGLFNEALRWKADREMWIRLFGRAYTRTDRGRFVVLDEIVGFRRLRDDSQQQQFSRLPDDEKQAALEAFEAAVDAALGVKERIWSDSGNRDSDFALARILREQSIEANRLLSEAGVDSTTDDHVLTLAERVALALGRNRQVTK